MIEPTNPFANHGWRTLYEWLLAALEPSWHFTFDVEKLDGKHIAGGRNWSPEPPRVIIDFARSKFASLRVHYHLEFDAAFEADAKLYPNAAAQAWHDYGLFVDGIIHFADTLSRQTCEVTGKPGKLYNRDGWYATLAPEVAAKQGAVEVTAPEETE